MGVLAPLTITTSFISIGLKPAIGFPYCRDELFLSVFSKPSSLKATE
jgi:hypothetical protein